MRLNRLTQIGGLLALTCAWSLGGLTLATVSGCEDNNLEDAADNIEDAADDAGDAVQDAADDAADNIEDATE